MGFSKQIVTSLVILALLCAWGEWVVLASFSGETSDAVNFEAGSKPFIYYALHGLSMLSVVGAGILAAVNGAYGKLDTKTKAAFWVLQITSLCWGAAAYSFKEVINWKALGATGPMVWLACIFVFAGIDRSIWKKIDPLIRVIAYITACLALYEMAKSGFTIKERWFSAHVRYMVLLMWFGGWAFLSFWNAAGWKLLLRCFPYIVFVFTCIVTRTRSWLLMSIFLFISLFAITKRTGMSPKQIRVIRTVIPYFLVMVFLLVGLFATQTIQNAIQGMMERLNVDSRTGQYVEFFEQVPLTDLILGRGPKGSYVFGGREEYQFFDNAYIWMAFIGGLPILLSYFVFIILPGFKAYFKGARDQDAVASVLVILWGLACTGISTYSIPSLNPYCYLLYLMTGRCLGYLYERKHSGNIAETGGTAAARE